MNANELFPPSEFLKSEDIDAAGGEMQLTISAVGRKEYEENGKRDVKGVIQFSDCPKKLTSNVTNTRVLITMFGSETDDWIGKKIILYVDEHVQYAGKEVRGIRVRLIDAKTDLITQFWTKAREMGMTQQDGRDHLALHQGSFADALKALQAQ